jgi:hypothetical protein
MKMGILVSLILMGAVSFAQVLTPIEASTETELPIDQNAPDYPCDQIQTQLEKYASMAGQHDQSVANFLSEVVNKVSGWYSLLQPLEGSPATLPEGTFAPLQDGADKINRVSDLAIDNSALLATEIDRILQSLKACQLTPLPTVPARK